MLDGDDGNDDGDDGDGDDGDDGDDDDDDDDDLKAVIASCRPFFSELSCQEMSSQPSGKPWEAHKHE